MASEAPKAPGKGPGKGPAKGKGKGKSPATEAAPAAEEPKAEAAEVVEEVKETTEAPAAKAPAKGPGKGPGKGPAKGKGKSPAAGQAEPPAAEAVADPEAGSEAAAKAPAKAPAKGPGKGPGKGPPKGKGKSPAEEAPKEVKFEEAKEEAVPAASGAGSDLKPSDHLNGVSVDLNAVPFSGQLLKRGPVYGYAFQERWCILTNTQFIVYKDDKFTQRQSAERLTPDALAVAFRQEDAPGEAEKHRSDKAFGFVLDCNPSMKSRKPSYFDAETEEKMTSWLEALKKVAARRKEAVTLHVYDLSTGSIEGATKPLGTGHFHVGLEVHGNEWSYGFSESGSGVFSSTATFCEPHSYRDAIELGYTSLSEDAVAEKVNELKEQWPGSKYDALKNNCCNFCQALCEALGVTLPPWILRLASVGQGTAGKDRLDIIKAAQAA